MKRRAEIAKELAALRAQSHPGEYHAELRKIVIQHSGADLYLRELLNDLRTAYPIAFEDAITEITVNVRLKQKAFRFASFLESKIGKDKWATQQNIDKRTLTRDETLYDSNAKFHAEVEGYRELLRMIQ